MPRTRYVDDHSLGGHDLAHKKIREQEVAQVIRCEMHFKPVCGLCVVFNGHDTRVVDETVKAVNARVDGLRCMVD